MKKIKGAVVKAANIDIQYLGGGSLFIQVQHGLHIEESERQGGRESERASASDLKCSSEKFM